MATINSKGYLERKAYTIGRKATNKARTIYYNWYTIKENERGKGTVILNTIFFSPEHIGKRVRFKIEFVEDR